LALCPARSQEQINVRLQNSAPWGAWVFVIGSCSFALGLEIPPHARVRNVGPRCAWASIEALGRARDIRPLHGLLARRCRVVGCATDDAVNAQLKVLGVRFRNERHGTYNRATLQEANGRGCVVSMRAGTQWFPGRPLWTLHSIVLTSYDDKQVTFYCSDNPHLLFTRSRAWFDAGWAGNALVILEEEEKTTPNPAERSAGAVAANGCG
jgi:hypothetical protein